MVGLFAYSHGVVDDNLPIMAEADDLVPPHLNAETYRQTTTGRNTIPYLDFIQIHKDGTALIGCSELTGRYWNGGAKVMKSVKETKDIESFDKSCIMLSSGHPTGCFVETSEKVLLCEDNGTISIWAHSTSAWSQWEQVVSVSEHDDSILDVDCITSGLEYVTVGADYCIKIWDVNDLICQNNYPGAHSAMITSVAVKPFTQTFATGSLDRHVSLWDKNVKDEVATIAKLESGARCVQWLDDNRLLIGDNAGKITLVDTRNTTDIQHLITFPAPVHKIIVQESKHVAVCCNNKTVSVFEYKDNQLCLLLREGKKHSNYVRGLAWDHEDRAILHTVAWDGTLETHKFKN